MKATLSTLLMVLCVVCYGKEKKGWGGEGLKGKVKSRKYCSFYSYNGDATLANKTFTDKDGFGIDTFSNAGQHLSYYYIKNGNKTNYSEYKYNAAGKLLEKLSHNLDENNFSKDIYTYDAAGNNVTYMGYNVKGELSMKATYKYSNGRIVEEIIEGVFDMRKTYKYDEAGNDTEVIFHYKNNDKNDKSYSRYHYNSEGNCIEVLQYNPDGTYKGKSVYAYDAQNNRISAMEYDANNGLKKSSHDEYTYDSYGNTIKLVRYSGDLPNFVFLYEYTYY